MPQRTPEEKREYMRRYRASKKKSGENGSVPPTEHIVLRGEPPVPVIETDAERGLPRSNYYSNHSAPGGWGEVIRNADQHTIDTILNKIAPPRRERH